MLGFAAVRALQQWCVIVLVPKRLPGWTVAMAVVWLVLVDGELRSPVLAFVVVVAAAATATRLGTAIGWTLRPLGALRFVPFFVRASLLGGIDVIIRAVAPSRPLAPDFLTYRLRLDPQSVAATFFVYLVSLLPGTLSAEVGPDGMVVHVVDGARSNREDLQRLERRVAEVFGAELDEPKEARA